jgi:hypothetical protein
MGGPLTLAHSIYAVAYHFFSRQLGTRKLKSYPFLGTLLQNMFGGGTGLTRSAKLKLAIRGRFLRSIRIATGRASWRRYSTGRSANCFMNFQCIDDFSIPEYPDLQLHFPPVLDVLDFVDEEGFCHIHVSTPGLQGLLG